MPESGYLMVSFKEISGNLGRRVEQSKQIKQSRTYKTQIEQLVLAERGVREQTRAWVSMSQIRQSNTRRRYTLKIPSDDQGISLGGFGISCQRSNYHYAA